MDASRLAVWIVGAAVSGAWLASAAGVTRQARVARAASRPPEAVQFDALAAEVQAQTVRLRERLAQAPAPSATDRNPFTFYTEPARRRVAASTQTRSPIEHEASLSAPEAREPVLELVGIAETTKPEGIVRTAMITGGYDDLIMVTAGQRILGRYDVISIQVDAVELKDVETGGTRRLVLR